MAFLDNILDNLIAAPAKRFVRGGLFSTFLENDNPDLGVAFQQGIGNRRDALLRQLLADTPEQRARNVLNFIPFGSAAASGSVGVAGRNVFGVGQPATRGAALRSQAQGTFKQITPEANPLGAFDASKLGILGSLLGRLQE